MTPGLINFTVIAFKKILKNGAQIFENLISRIMAICSFHNEKNVPLIRHYYGPQNQFKWTGIR